MLKTFVRKPQKNILVSVEGEQCFWMSSGQILCNLKDLREALGSMNDDTFVYHVNKEKNDFAKWVEEVLGDTTVANQLERNKTRASAYKAIDTYLKKNYS